MSIKINEEQTFIFLEFSEPVYSRNDGTGVIDQDHFTLSLEGGIGKLYGSTGSVVKTNNTYKISLTYLLGPFNGEEKLTINIVKGGVFDKNGNVIPQIEKGNVLSLYDTTVPEIIKTTLSEDNSKLEVEFSKEIFNGVGKTDITVDNFIYELDGGIGKLLKNTPTSVSVDGNKYTLGVAFSKIPNGEEKLKVDVVKNTVYGKNNLVVDDEQINNVVDVNDKVQPTMIIESKMINNDDIVKLNEIIFTFKTSKKTDNFTIDDITLNNGILSNFSKKNNVYTVTFKPDGDSKESISYKLFVEAGKYTDLKGNENIESNIFTWSSPAFGIAPIIGYHYKNDDLDTYKRAIQIMDYLDGVTPASATIFDIIKAENKFKLYMTQDFLPKLFKIEKQSLATDMGMVFYKMDNYHTINILNDNIPLSDIFKYIPYTTNSNLIKIDNIIDLINFSKDENSFSMMMGLFNLYGLIEYLIEEDEKDPFYFKIISFFLKPDVLSDIV